MKIFVIIHKTGRDEGAVYDGSSEADISAMLVKQGLTFNVVDKATFDAFELTQKAIPPTPAEILAQFRAQAINLLLSDSSPTAKIIRAALFGLLDEINLLRQRDNDRAVDVAASTTLADLKVRWAARASLPDRTVAQAKTFIQDKINSGVPD